MGKYKTYEKYKSSGLEWLGDIPEHWSTIRIKFSTYVKGRIGWHGLKSDEFTDKGAYLVTGTDFESNQIDWSRCYHVSLERYVQDPYIQLQNGDLLITKDGTIGKTAIVFGLQGYATLNSGVFLTRPLRQDYLPEFLCWVLNSNCFYDYVNLSQTGTTINHLYQWTFENFAFQLPPIAEQKLIVHFLDHETTRIDTLITKKRQLIDLLQKKRDAIIDEAVTRGLDPSTKLKGTGISWIRQIPATWKLVRIKYLCKVISKGTTPTTIGSAFTSSGIRFIKAENIINGKVVDEPESFIDLDTHNLLKRSILEKLDVLIVIAGATIGKVGIVQENILPANTNQAVAFIRLNMPDDLSCFLFYWLCSSRLQDQIWLQAVQAAQPNLSLTSIGNFLIPYPSLREASEIVECLDNSIEKFDLLISKIEKSVKQLLKLRSSLITTAVTGKIDVREEANK